MPAITKPNLHFDATLYTGNGGTQSITNAGGFQPDFVWQKCRSVAYENNLYDVNRGTATLVSDGTYAENVNGASDFVSYNSNGFTINQTANYELSHSGATYVAWQWKAGGTAVTNTAGSLTSQVSANPTAGFSVVSYTSPNTSSDATVGHGLSAAPQFIIVKNRDSTFNWDIWHQNLSSGYDLVFATDAQASGRWSTTTPTSSVFTVKYNYEHYSTNRYIAYCWTSIPGYSQFASFVGNGTQGAGPFVYTGFQPKYVLIKNINGAYDWHCFDTARGQYNYSGSNILKPNSSAVELTARNDVQIDFLSNGFRLIGNDIGINQSGSTHIYAAFASAPFKYANAF